MTINIVNGITILTAADGYVLNKDDVYSSIVYLGKRDKPENWVEIEESEVPTEEDEDEYYNHHGRW